MSDSKNEKKITVKNDDCLTTIKSIISDFLLIDKIQTYQIDNANIIAAIFCRTSLLLIGLYFNYFLACTQKAKYYGLLTFTIVIIIETMHICIKRKGLDFKWYK
jgi:hypothetical protein